MPARSFFNPLIAERGFATGTSMLGQNTQPPFTLLDILGNQQGPGPALEDLKTMLLEPGGHPPLFPSLQEGTTPEEKISGMMFDFMPGAGVGGDVVGGLLGQTLFHAGRKQFQPAPNKPFGEFMSRFISSGVGDQWFGYGHYLGEEKKVGEYYRMLMEDDGGGLFFQGLTADEAGSLPAVVVDTLTNNAAGKHLAKVHPNATVSGPDTDERVLELVNDYITQFERELKKSPMQPFQKKEREVALSGLKKIRDNPDGVQLQRGVMMEVELDDSAIPSMLDWDEKLRDGTDEAGQIMLDAYQELGMGYRVGGATVGDFAGRDIYDATGAELYQDLGEKLYVKPRIEEYVRMGASAEEALQTAMADLAREKRLFRGKNFGDQDASAYLSSLGMPGLRFLDRYSKEGKVKKLTRNYVVFPGQEDYLNIKGLVE